MDLTPSPKEADFREELRTWLSSNIPDPFLGDRNFQNVEYVAYLRAWQRTLAEAGWLGITWPEEYGGGGMSPVEQTIFLEEMAHAKAPPVIALVGIGIIGPTIAALGTEDQKQRFLRKMLLGDEIWAAGFSEPNAGSDLGSIATRAARDGDHFVVNGQKTWTSYAHISDWIFLIVRTDPDAPRFGGISCLLVDLKTEGVSVRPLKTIAGDATFNEVFFSNVRVPAEHLCGELNGGWQVLMTALMFERNNLGGDYAVHLADVIDRMVAAARGRGVVDDPVFRQKIAQAHVELEVFNMISARALDTSVKAGSPGAESAILKLYWSELNQRTAQWATEILGPYGQLTVGEAGEFSYNYLKSRGSTIAAGTSEVMRNTIATRVLGLPKSF